MWRYTKKDHCSAPLAQRNICYILFQTILEINLVFIKHIYIFTIMARGRGGVRQHQQYNYNTNQGDQSGTNAVVSCIKFLCLFLLVPTIFFIPVGMSKAVEFMSSRLDWFTYLWVFYAVVW
jgi:hypothetical protein